MVSRTSSQYWSCCWPLLRLLTPRLTVSWKRHEDSLSIIDITTAPGPLTMMFQKQQRKPIVHTLVQSECSWDGTAYDSYPAGRPELAVLKIDIPARTVLPWHTHPMPNVGYVVSGVLIVERKADRKKHRFGPGEAVPEMVDTPHRGYTEDKPVQLIVFYCGTRDLPLSL